MDNLRLFRHYIATLAYRAGYAIDNSPESFKTYKGSEDGWTTLEILEHLAQLVNGSLLVYKGDKYDHSRIPDWDEAKEKFFDGCKKLDDYFAENGIQNEELFIKLYHGPLLDAMTHVGQLMMHRRLSGNKLEPKPYWEEPIEPGRFRYEY